MIAQLRTAGLMLLLMTILTGIAYPLATTGLAQIFFNDQANGSLITRDGQVIGSELIGQSFSDPKYFHGRPSAAGDGYDASASSGSNYGPTNKALMDRVDADLAQIREENGLAADAPVPVDLVTASASGLDPHVSVASAYLQAPRIAQERGIEESLVRELIDDHVEGRTLGVLGESRVNVLDLNIALDNQYPV